MQTTPNTRNKWVSKLLIIVMLITVVSGIRPIRVRALDYNDYYNIERLFDRVIVAFDPSPGTFPATEVFDGLRYPNRGETLTNFPPNPTRTDGYVFNGWQLNGYPLTATYLVANDNIALTAIWIRYSEAPDTTPAPDATPTPSPSPAPDASPTPSPAPATPSPTPNPDDKAQDGYRPNPGTNPIAISFMIFGAVLGLGIAAFYIVKVTAQHALEKEQYRTDATRYKREARLAEFLEDEDIK